MKSRHPYLTARGRNHFCFLVLSAALLSVIALASSENAVLAATPTEIRLAYPGWWPSKGTASSEEYVGSRACLPCHSDISRAQQNTPMSRALELANSASIPDLSHNPAEFHANGLNYELSAKDQLIYSVRDSKTSLSVPVNWIFGTGQFGRTFLYEYNGNYYESRLSYYSSARTLDFTTGNPGQTPGRLDAALGRRMSLDEVPLCFGCHATAASTSGQFSPTHLIPGVTCEACHGPGAAHVAQMSMGTGTSATLTFNPSYLNASDSVDYCGACHRTSSDVALMGVKGILTLRFPAYRLERSPCWEKKPDPRLTCISCHDPHTQLVRDAAAYDSKCLQCHAGAGAPKSEARNH